MTDQLQDDIQAYLDGKMPIEKIPLFEAQMADSSQLTAEINRYRMLRVVARNEDMFMAKTLVDNIMASTEIEADYGQYGHIFDKTGGKPNAKYWILGILVMIILTVSVWRYRYFENQVQIRRIATEHLAPLDNIIGFSPDDIGNAATALRAYEQGQYTEAIHRLQSELQIAPDDNGLRLYLAVSLLMQGQNTAAEPLLRQMVAAQDLTTVPATWYLALCLMQQGQADEAHLLLAPLRSDTIFGQRAQQVWESTK